jgi:hypothetical protein
MKPSLAVLACALPLASSALSTDTIPYVQVDTHYNHHNGVYTYHHTIGEVVETHEEQVNDKYLSPTSPFEQ